MALLRIPWELKMPSALFRMHGFGLGGIQDMSGAFHGWGAPSFNFRRT